MELTDEEREARRQRALALHADGKFGGAQPGSGRPRKKRASEVVAESVAAEGQLIYDTLIEIVRSGTDSNKMSAAKTLMEIEEKEAQRSDREDDKIEEMHRDQLLLMVASKLEALSDRGLIPGFAEVVDGYAVEVEDSGPSGPSEIPASTG